MRIKTYNNGGYSQGGFTTPGGTMTGPLVLSGNPTEDLHAAPKQYVDSVLSSFSAAKFTTGTLQVSRLPAMTGDAVSSVGGNTLNLISTGITAGVYTKVSVNAKGLITTASGLSESDIPGLDWSKFTTDKPTTLAGYGITDALPSSGGLINGDLTLHADPTNAMHLATKQYVDSKMVSNMGIQTGDVRLVAANAIPVGYLRCNGALVNKTTYPALYAIIGDNVVTEYNDVAGSGQPWRQQYQFNTTQSADITGWGSHANLSVERSVFSTLVTKNRVYILGGWNASGDSTNTIYTAPIAGDGTIGAWTTSGTLPVVISGTSCVVTKNRVYLFGGYTTTTVSSVYTAPINADGTLGSWTSGPSLPAARRYTSAVYTKNRVYVIGGAPDTNPSAAVYTATVDSDGVIGSWTTGTSLPSALSSAGLLTTKNWVHIIGGNDGDSGGAVVYRAPINSDGTLGAWVTGTSLPTGLSSSSLVATRSRVYVLGGYTRTPTVATVFTAPINADGTLGAWVTGTSLPRQVGTAGVVCTSTGIYVMGGRDGTNIVKSVSVAPFSGGLSDYSSIYTQGYQATDPTYFKLPDTTLTDPVGSASVIKF